MPQRPPIPPPEQRRPREQTRPGGFGAPGPTIRESGDDPAAVARIDDLEEKLRVATAEIERRDKVQLQQARSRSYSPPPSMPPVRIERDDPGLPSVRPTRDIVINVLRLAGPQAWIVMIVGLLLWKLPELTELVRAAKGEELRPQLQLQATEIGKLRTEIGHLRAHEVECDKDTVTHRSHLSQVFERQAVEWPLAEGAAPTTGIKTEAPIRRPGVVTKGPSLIVKTPMTLPPAVPSAGQ